MVAFSEENGLAVLANIVVRDANQQVAAMFVEQYGVEEGKAMRMIAGAMISQAIAAFAGDYHIRTGIDTEAFTIKIFEMIKSEFNLDVIFKGKYNESKPR